MHAFPRSSQNVCSDHVNGWMGLRSEEKRRRNGRETRSG